MTQNDIMRFLDEHKGVYYTAKEIYEAIKGASGEQGELANTYKCLKKIVKREEYNFKIMPTDKVGRGCNFITLYCSNGGR